MAARAGPSSSYQSQDPPPRPELWWDRLPSLKIVRPPRGQFSPQVDERCFTYCSQSISGRLHGTDPWCRTICFRRVFTHEVNRVLAHHRTKTVNHVPGRKPIVEFKDEVESVPVNHPLPPEGQRYSGWLAMLLGDSQRSQEDDPHGLVQEQAQRLERETKYWQEGWYLWWTSSRWASQEKLDLMHMDLKSQTEWQRLKDRRNDEWARGLPPFDDPNAQHADGEHPQVELHPFEDLGNMPPFPNVTPHSLLLPLPTVPSSLSELSNALSAQLKPALAPMGSVLALVRESVESGAQKEFWGRAWEKARSDEPRKLLIVGWEKVRENFWGKEDDENGTGTSPKPGKEK
ncbi:hypothetical protein C8Q74DRAFT_1230845 [Fomes fomentarius]|nr:hypothetical protein C8Q74DRAFT_1230845 [Fomes fomentarius]